MTESEAVVQYILRQEAGIQEILRKTQKAISSVLPHSNLIISWSMPTFKDKKNIIHFAANKSHLGIYPGPKTIEAFQYKLEPYKFSKGAVQFPYKDGIPYKLIQEMALYSYESQKE